MAKYIPKAHHGSHSAGKTIRTAKPSTSEVKTERCNHCGGAMNNGRGFDLGPGCAMCGRAQGHMCQRCVTIPEADTSND